MFCGESTATLCIPNPRYNTHSYTQMNAPFVDGAVVERVEEHLAAGIHHCHPHPERHSVSGH